MASNVISDGLNLMSTAYNGETGIVLSGDAVKGGYFVTDTIDNIPIWARTDGTLCFCTSSSAFFKYSDVSSAWEQILSMGQLDKLARIADIIEIS